MILPRPGIFGASQRRVSQFRSLNLLACGLLCLLTGCAVGRNSTLFVTKSNVGLDISGPPTPTFQLALARKEGVVAPQFAGGHKPPVLASFRFSNKGAFSPNVGSTFATGDAATTLAALYGDKTPTSADGKPTEGWTGRAGIVTDGLPTDSTIHLDEEPTLTGHPPWSWLSKAIGTTPSFQKNDVRAVFMGTDTAVGVKVTWSGLSGAFPDSANFGYNRKELAYVPVTMREKNSVDEKSVKHTTYEMKMASLIATVDSGVNGIQDAQGKPVLNAQHMQYFATGNAATMLALQQDVRSAMLARLDPNAGNFKARFQATHNPEQAKVITRALAQVYDSLKSLAGDVPPDPVAAQHLKQLDALAVGFGVPASFSEKQVVIFSQSLETVNAKQEMALKEDGHRNVGGAADFESVLAYWSGLRKSLDILEKWKPFVDGDIEIALVKDGNVPANKAKLTAAEKKLFYDQISLQTKLFTPLDQAFGDNDEIVAAYSYLQSLISPK